MRRRHRRRRLLLACGATAAVVAALASLGWVATSAAESGARAVWVKADDAAPGEPMIAAQPAPVANPTALPLLHPNKVTVNAPGFWSWALLDRTTGVIVGSPNFNKPQYTASMIKAWLAADYLRLAAQRGQTPSSAALKQLSIMIRDSDNAAASATYVSVGKASSISRLIKLCGLTDSKAGADWAHTLISARDAIRMGQCIADGRGAGPKWTEWVLTEMRAVRGVGRFGPIEVLPAAEAKQTAIKNGWVVLKDGNYHVNCLAVGPEWVLAVENVYPSAKGLAQGNSTCKSVTQQLMATPT